MAVLQKGDEGSRVRELQNLLKQKGYYVNVDGIFGKQTLLAIKAFQRDNLLVVDGIIGPATLNELKRNKKSLTEADYHRAAAELGVDTATIKAVTAVESAGRGFKTDGRVKILFEGHKFYKFMDEKLGNAELVTNDDNKDILYPSWTKKYYNKDQWDRLERAMLIDKEAALMSASYGLFQIMGFNYQQASFGTVQAFVDFNTMGEGQQLLCFVRICLNQGWHKYLKTKDWAGFAKRYNGPGYKKNKYDTKMAAAYKKFSK